VTALRSPGWTVRPSFVPHGATNDVTLVADERALTQLTGVPDVAWQTPWEELSHVHLVRLRRGMALFATAAGVRYCWRTSDLTDYEAWRGLVLAHGGMVARRPRRVGALVVVGVVLLASFAGGIAAFFTSSSSSPNELAAARAVNLRLDDLPSGWRVIAQSYLLAIVPQPGKVFSTPNTPVTTAAPTSHWGQISAIFQGCLGVSSARDRVFGAAGQNPDYQVTSSLFRSESFGGIDLASTTQYYRTTTMVHNDVTEMSEPRFGSCFAAVNKALILSAVNGTVPPHVVAGASWHPVTFVRGFASGGQIEVSVPGVSTPVHLVIAVVAAGHFETTLVALVAQWPQSQSFLASTVNTLLGRETSTSATPV
jgi:hypothetical protein